MDADYRPAHGPEGGSLDAAEIRPEFLDAVHPKRTRDRPPAFRRCRVRALGDRVTADDGQRTKVLMRGHELIAPRAGKAGGEPARRSAAAPTSCSTVNRVRSPI
jgi:hypothetical protein